MRGLEADLHTHSTASDGTLTPAELAHEAARRGLTVFALTDHDTVAGIPDASYASHQLGLTLVPGVELSTRVDRGEVHILGYGINPNSQALQAALDRFRGARRTRATRMIERLRHLGVSLDTESLEGVSDASSIGRPHIARLLIESGHASNVQDAFDRYLGRGRPAYVAREALDPADAVHLIRDAGGVPVFAHPLSDPSFEARLSELSSAGLQGLEVYYGEYSDDERNMLAAIAEDRQLLRTGGSDYHGPDFREGRELGSVHIPRQAIEAFLVAVGIDIEG